MSQLADLLHKIVDVAAGDSARPDLHDEIDALGTEPESAPEESPEAEAAPEPEDQPVPAPEAAPVDDGAQVQGQVQEESSSDG